MMTTMHNFAMFTSRYCQITGTKQKKKWTKKLFSFLSLRIVVFVYGYFQIDFQCFIFVFSIYLIFYFCSSFKPCKNFTKNENECVCVCCRHMFVITFNALLVVEWTLQ